MSHGFTRFGPAPARERLHRQMRGPGTISMLLPTIVATLFMFTVVITLNKASSLTRGGRVVRLMNVDDVFPTPAAVEQNRKKEFWELTDPPPSPDAVLGAQIAEIPTLAEEPVEVLYWYDDFSPPPEIPAPARPTLKIDFTEAILPRQRTTTPRVSSVPIADLPPPAIAPDTSLPVATPTP